MGHWTKQAKIGPIDFDGDTITLFVDRLTVSGMQQIMPFMKQNQKSKEVTVSFEDSMKMIEVATKLIPAFVKTIDGMKDGEGNIISAERFNKELIHDFYFTEFTAAILAGLCEVSIVSESDEKNSGTPSNGLSQEPIGTDAKLVGVS